MVVLQLTRDQERFKSCLKKSKGKAIVMDVNSSGERFWYFPDVDQTGWHHDAIGEMLDNGMIEPGSMQYGRYTNIKWVA